MSLAIIKTKTNSADSCTVEAQAWGSAIIEWTSSLLMGWWNAATLQAWLLSHSQEADPQPAWDWNNDLCKSLRGLVIASGLLEKQRQPQQGLVFILAVACRMKGAWTAQVHIEGNTQNAIVGFCHLMARMNGPSYTSLDPLFDRPSCLALASCQASLWLISWLKGLTSFFLEEMLFWIDFTASLDSESNLFSFCPELDVSCSA